MPISRIPLANDYGPTRKLARALRISRPSPAFTEIPDTIAKINDLEGNNPPSIMASLRAWPVFLPVRLWVV